MSAITKPTAAGSGGLTLAQLQAEATNQGELDTSLSAISQAVATLGSQLQSAGAVPGELRVFSGAHAPAGWLEVDRSTPPQLSFEGTMRSLMTGPRALTSVTSNTQSVCVAGEHNGYSYYMLNPGANRCYLERMNITTGITSAVATHPFDSFDSRGGLYVSFCAIVGDYLYAFGGRSTYNLNVQATWRLNLLNTAAGWSQLQSMPTPVFSTGTPVVVGSKIYVFGGIAGDANIYRLNTVQVFNTTTNAWSTLAATLPLGAVEHCQCALMPNGTQILCVGGYTGSVEVRKYAFLDTLTNTFSPTYDLPATWLDRPRAIYCIPGKSFIQGICNVSGVMTIVEFDGTAWTDTGVIASFYNNVVGNIALSDNTHFQPACLTYYWAPGVKHAHGAASQTRVLCKKL